jgi:hypothetical protein
VAVAAVAIALGMTPLLPVGVPVILAATAALGGALASPGGQPPQSAATLKPQPAVKPAESPETAKWHEAAP